MVNGLLTSKCGVKCGQPCIVDTSIEPSLGKIRSLSADSCKHIREVLATDCTNLPNSGVYWVQDMQVWVV